MILSLTSRVLVLGMMWLGLSLLKWDGAMSPLFWQALIFTAIVLVGSLMEQLFHYQGDPYILPVVQAIMALGLVFVVRVNPGVALHQFWWANIGLLMFYTVLWAIRDYRSFGRFRYIWGLLAVGLLLVTLVFGSEEGGATSSLKFWGFGFQPEEFVKLALLLFMATYLVENEELLRIGTVQWGRFSLPDWRTLGPFMIMVAFVLGLLAAQKSLGTALVFYLLFVLMLYVVTERALYLGISIPIFLLTGTVGYMLFRHVRVRVSVWLDPWQDPTGMGYQIAQSLFAIGGGNILGTGLGNGIGASTVPVAISDFIFSVIAEELGFAGAMAVLVLFLIVVMRAFVVSIRAKDRFGQILAAGIGILLGTETLIILAGVTKLFPLTGLPLPWVSYGGSSLIVHFILLGVLLNISNATATSSHSTKNKGREYAT
ncbi:FtsW/RodA/SpoVE family cell cycle protein [Desulfosporosinus sp. BICA1-9]|uniref:FtsW/RodA/SpoVE family cell cycle protein n=1 Tax=Desulfosporosinus sp. BICA1-9 TaxID=1531958 RepID=UPI00054C6051|nr:FtsW/RodA/SpoVE family cell cycle protein [Desulfosporosinus sp. BICA1-9]KJS48697.1 MAG: cell division protein [Peptococcaceae bacterium BRH_c23]KJS90481.1 MAG: cell division protein [Desulfosporosinus sp. BICA1-9]HBW38434.1 cell division protein [Desulfosporosinus sp.]